MNFETELSNLCAECGGDGVSEPYGATQCRTCDGTGEKKNRKGESMNLNELLEKRAATVREKEGLDEKVDDLKAEIKTLDEAVLAKFDAEGISNAKVPELGTFSMTERVWASIPKEQKERGIELFRKHFPDLVTTSINTNTLSAFMKDAKANGQELPAEIVEIVKLSPTRGIRWNRV